MRFNAAGPDGLIDRKAPGESRTLDDEQRQSLAALVENWPIPAIHEAVRWGLVDLARWLYEEFGLSSDGTTVSRELKALGFAKISARPRH